MAAQVLDAGRSNVGAGAARVVEKGWLSYSIREGIERSGGWFAGSTLVALGSRWLPWLHDRQHQWDGWQVLGDWDLLWPGYGSGSTLTLVGALLVLAGGWALLRRGLLSSALVVLVTTLGLVLALLTVADATNGFRGFERTWDVGLLLFILASLGMVLAAGTAVVLHLLAIVLDVPFRSPRPVS